jgi:hypothetical protein
MRKESDAAGLIRRGDLILAVRPIEHNKAHNDAIRAKNKRLAGHNKAKAQELRDFAREAGVNSKVLEGYEDNE